MEEMPAMACNGLQIMERAVRELEQISPMAKLSIYLHIWISLLSFMVDKTTHTRSTVFSMIAILKTSFLMKLDTKKIIDFYCYFVACIFALRRPNGRSNS
jgi:hypothetical protein